ncbi:CDGSH iron-sulfur domain-containing protein [Helicovermis profundi]|uniref:CDGSH iron-sulfur domain-containing protein n=1 Tax=Helicovermis profundi TaxID=3065157 RepID=A0AAU9EDS6_9FIRM|nr:CDGSH iron-sulfur domain-containing protein [Clostridia bacterium S502]
MKKNISIKPLKNGPYLVSELEEILDSEGQTNKCENSVTALCRCGKSKTKPYCDGSHIHENFSDEKEKGRKARKVDNYVGKEITIHDDRGICSHAGFCTGGLPKVFRMNTEPWIDADGETVKSIIEVIKKCPSGALSYSIDGVKYDKYSDEQIIELTKNGPYHIKGSINLDYDEDHPQSDEHYALCRCGHSKNKPFCDGSHWYKEFKDDGKVNK